MGKPNDSIVPPKWAERFLAWFCAPNLLEEVHGDILEVFEENVEEKGRGKANMLFVWYVLKFFNYSTIIGNRKLFQNQIIVSMYYNYFKIAFRNLVKYKLYSFVNISGLAIALACAILVMFYVKDELSFDTFHEKSDRIYRTWVKEDYGNNEIYFNAVVPYPLAGALQDNIPEVDKIVRLSSRNATIKKNDYSENEQVFTISPNFLEVFDYELLRGKKETVLAKPENLLITEAMAEKYFGTADVVGKTLELKIGDEFQVFEITGLMADAPKNSSLQYDFFISDQINDALLNERQKNAWFSVGYETYVLLKPEASLAEVPAKLETMMRSILKDDYPENGYQVGLQPLTDIHLNTEVPVGLVAISDGKYVYILSAVAILILIVATINFMTLVIGRSITRAKEVGIRKVVGARKMQLRQQFWSEAVLTVFVSMVVGLALTIICLPIFNQIAGKNLSFSLDLNTIISVLGLAIIVGIVAGSYPAIVLASFSPVKILKGNILQFSGKSGKELFRKVMVTFQFALAMMLIAGTLLMKKQLNYLQNENLGFDKEQVIVIPLDLKANGFANLFTEGRKQGDIFKEALANLSEVKEVAVSAHTFDQNGWMGFDFRDDEGVVRKFSMNVIDEDFLETYQLELLEGRNLSKEFPADVKEGLLVNEAFVKEFQLKNPVGQYLPIQFTDYKVVGVVKDFHFESLYSEIAPTMLVINPEGIFQNIDNSKFGTSPRPKASIKVQSEDMIATLRSIENTYEKVFPNAPFSFNFVDDALDQRYRKEQQLGSVLDYAAVLGVLISCLGLFGLVALILARKTKEIGMRKVLGASTRNILMYISKEFVIMVFFALMIAAPVTYYLVTLWLQDFAYRITVGVEYFALSGGIILVVALGTISYQTMKAAVSKPIDSLRSE